jgi:integrase
MTTDIHAEIRRLKPGQSVSRGGVEVCRLGNGDLSYKLDIVVVGRRCRDALGRQSEGMSPRRAQELAQARRAELRRTVGLAPQPASEGPRMAFAKAARAYLESQEQTGAKNLQRKRFHLERRLIPYLGERAIGRLDEELLQAYRQQRRAAKASDSLINREFASLSHALAWMAAGSRKWIPRAHGTIPWTREERIWREVLTAEERQRLLDASAEDRDPHCYPFVAILLNTAMRHSEVTRMRWEHIDWDRGVISIPQAKSGARVQPATAELMEILREVRAQAADPAGWVFPNRRPSFATHPHVVSMRVPFRRAAVAARIDPKRCTPHLCRHSAVTMLAGLGIGTFVLQQISGHHSARILEHYIHVHGPEIRQAAAHLGVKLMRKSPETPPPAPAGPGTASGTAGQIIAFPKKTG